MGIGVDWMGLTLATGLSSGRAMGRLKTRARTPEQSLLVWKNSFGSVFWPDCTDFFCSLLGANVAYHELNQEKARLVSV